MVSRALDGIGAARAIKDELRAEVQRLAEDGIVPGLGTLLVGDDPASRSYIGGKHRDCAEVGIRSVSVELPASATLGEVAEAIDDLNGNPEVTGFIAQLPLPGHLDENAVLEMIDPSKDADGLHPLNLGKLLLGDGAAPVPCTPRGIVELLRRNEVDLAGRHVVVIGRGLTVGRPLGLLLTRQGVDATVTTVHSRSRDAAAEAKRADVVIAAAGRPHLVTREWVQPGAAVIDVGVTRVGTTNSGKARLAGDVAPEIAEVAGWLSPNPGGVGPMTRAMLLANVVEAARRRTG